jgi:hypothetical protein
VSSTHAGSSRVSKQPTKQPKSPNNIEERIGTWKEISITDRHNGQAYARKAPPPPSTDSFSILASGAAEMYLESEEWAMEEPRDWVVILAEMRKNVQSRAASLLGHVPLDLGDHLPPRNSKQSGSKVCITTAATVASLQNSSNSLIGRLSVNAEQSDARVTTPRDPSVDANRVIYPP